LRRIARDAVIICAVTVVLFVCGEIAARLTIGGAQYYFHPNYIYGLSPNYSQTYQRMPEDGGDVINWRTNGAGFRGAELSNNPRFRIIVYGDSNIFGMFSRRENTYAVRLASHLKTSTGKDFEVINGGIGGFGPGQNLLKFMDQAETFQPDLVVFHIFADNDFGDLVRNGLFFIDSEGRLIRNDDKNIANMLYLNGQSELLTRLSEYSTLVRGATKLSPFLFNLLKPGVEAPKNTEDEIRLDFEDRKSESEYQYARYQSRDFNKKVSHLDRYDVDISTSPHGESAKVKRKLMAGVLNRGYDFARRNDIQFMVLVQPSSRDVSSNMKPNYEYFSRFTDYRRDRHSSDVEDICERNGIPVLNLFQPFMNNDPDSLYFGYRDTHWNDAGQDLAAQLTAEYIQANMLEQKAEKTTPSDTSG